MSRAPFRPLFRIAAGFNAAVGAPMLLAPALVYGIAGMTVPASLLEARMVGAFVLLFGGLYWIIGERDGRDPPLVALAVSGKTAAFGLTVGSWLAGQAPALFALLGGIDGVFGLLFLNLLLRDRRPGLA